MIPVTIPSLGSPMGARRTGRGNAAARQSATRVAETVTGRHRPRVHEAGGQETEGLPVTARWEQFRMVPEKVFRRRRRSWLPTCYWPGAVYPLGPRFARPRAGLAGGRAPSDPRRSPPPQRPPNTPCGRSPEAGSGTAGPTESSEPSIPVLVVVTSLRRQTRRRPPRRRSAVSANPSARDPGSLRRGTCQGSRGRNPSLASCTHNAYDGLATADGGGLLQ